MNEYQWWNEIVKYFLLQTWIGHTEWNILRLNGLQKGFMSMVPQH